MLGENYTPIRVGFHKKRAKKVPKSGRKQIELCFLGSHRGGRCLAEIYA